MPIRIPDLLPARETLVQEGVMVMDETHAVRQDIRPIHIGLLNLMPNKIRTETQIARLVGATPLQVELTLIRVGSHKAKNTPEEHLIERIERGAHRFVACEILEAGVELADDGFVQGVEFFGPVDRDDGYFTVRLKQE